MGIKKVTVSFDVPITAFLGLIATGHSEMKLSVYGDEPRKPKLNKPDVKLLPAPKKANVQGIILQMLAARETVETKTLKQGVASAGFSPKSINSQMHHLKRKKMIRPVAHGVYKLTAGGQKAVAHG